MDYPDGRDIVWLATDGVGAIAVFITAGQAPIPQTAFVDGTVDENYEDELLTLPATSAVRLTADPEGAESYHDLASRGFYVYDWLDIHRSQIKATQRYELVALPESPAAFSTLPPHLRQAVALIRFKTLKIGEVTKIDPTREFACILRLKPDEQLSE